jgi:hypothetical protein
MLPLGKHGSLESEANLEPSAEAVEDAWDGAIGRYARRWGIGYAWTFEVSGSLSEVSGCK